MGRPEGGDDGEEVVEEVVELSALERLFEGEADPADPEPEGETSPEAAQSSSGADA